MGIFLMNLYFWGSAKTLANWVWPMIIDWRVVGTQPSKQHPLDKMGAFWWWLLTLKSRSKATYLKAYPPPPVSQATWPFLRFAPFATVRSYWGSILLWSCVVALEMISSAVGLHSRRTIHWPLSSWQNKSLQSCIQLFVWTRRNPAFKKSIQF